MTGPTSSTKARGRPDYRGGSGGLVLDARDLGKTFPGGAEPALAGISMAAKAGMITGLVGPDGAGKTTFLRLAAGLLHPSSGTLEILGGRSGEDVQDRRGRVGYMPQVFGLYQDLTVQENLDLFADLRGLPLRERANRFEELLLMTDLRDFRTRRAGRLSGGMKQKLGLACAMIERPELLLLDEPTVGVDPVSRRDLWLILRQLASADDMGVVVATAYLDEADRCDHIVALDRGRVSAAGTPASFQESMVGRVFLVAPGTGVSPRAVQARLIRQPAIIDCSIRSGRLRCVTKEAADASSPGFDLPPEASGITAARPCFEDAFMALQHRPEHAAFTTTLHPEGKKAAPSGREDMVVVTALGKNFGAFQAVAGIDFRVRRGEVFGLLGPNGAGKTTTFRMLCGLLKANEGEIRVAGQDLRRSPGRARARLGYMAQSFSLYRQLTVAQNLRFYGRAYGLGGARLERRLDEALVEFDLRDRADQDAGNLPMGFRQRLAMAAATIHEPEILFLDEPTSGADPLARREFWLRISSFAERGITVIVTTHFMEEVEYCDRVLVMSRGRELARGTPEEIRNLARGPENPEPTIEDAFIALSEGRIIGTVKMQESSR